MNRPIALLFLSFIVCSSLYAQVVGTGNGGPDEEFSHREQILKNKQKICAIQIKKAKDYLKEFYNSHPLYSDIKEISDQELNDFLSYKSIVNLIQRKNFIQGTAEYKCSQEEEEEEEEDQIRPKVVSPLMNLAEELKVLKNEKCHESKLNTPLNLDDSTLEVYIERIILMERLNEL